MSAWSEKYAGMDKGHPFYVWNEALNSHYPWDWNDYESMMEWSTYPVIGRIFETRMKQLEYEENQRYWSDKARNMGFGLDDVSYPIRTGIYGSYVGTGDYFEASESVINLFSKKLLRW